MVQKQQNQKILMFQCDGGGEFTSNNFVTHLSNHGIKQMISCPHTPQQNGIAERKHRHITELGLSMLFDGNVPQRYWVEAFFTSSFFGNLLPSSALVDNKSPYETLFNKKPEYSSLRIFCSACYPSLRPYTANKLDPKSLQSVFLGYNEKYKGYHCLHPPTGKVYINRHVLFDEQILPFSTTYSHLHQQQTTALLSAWQQSFLRPQKASETYKTSPASNETTFVQFGTLPSEYVVSPAINVAPLQSIPPYTSSSPSLSPFINQSGPQTSETSQPTETEQQMLSERTRPQSFVQFGTLSSDVLQRSQSTDTTPLPSSGSQAISTSERNGTNPENGQNQTEVATNLSREATTEPIASPAPQLSVSSANQSVHPMITRSKVGTVKPNPRYVLFTVTSTPSEPRTVKEALKHPGWNGAMTEEMVSF